MNNRRLLGLVLVVVLLASALVLIPRRVKAAEPATGPMADEVIYEEITDDTVAVNDLNSGASDIREYSIASAATRQTVLNMPNAKPVEGSGSFWDMMVNSIPRQDGQLNPFSLQPVRESMNYLIDRDFILNEVYFGYGVKHIALYYQMEPDYGRQAAFFAGIEAKYQYNPTKAHDMITTAMTAAGATLNTNGKWTKGGNLVTIDFVIRIEDPRRTAWGNYVSGLLEEEGFTVTRDYKTSGQASPIVYSGNPTLGQWQAYTEGWGSSGLVLWDSTRGYQMFRWDAYSTQWDYRTVGNTTTGATATSHAIDDWYNGNFTSQGQRDQMIRTVVNGTLQDSMRIWIVAEQTFYVERKDITAVPDLSAALDNRLSIRSARRNDATGGTIVISQPTGWVGGWNPEPSGSTWAYDVNIQNNWADFFSVTRHPQTGKVIPLRANFQVYEASPGSTFNVQGMAGNAAERWNMATKAWESVPSTATAKSVVNYTYSFGKWQDGTPIDMTDILNFVSVQYRMADPAGDAYSPAHVGDYTLFLSNFVGLKVTGNNTVSVFLNYWHWDPAEVAAVGDIWTPVSSQVWELTIQAFKNGGIFYKEDDAEAHAGVWMNLAFGPSLTMLDHAMTDLITNQTVPIGVVGLETTAQAISRYANLTAFKASSAHPHYLDSNGPFYVASVDVATKTTVLKADRANYPLAPRTWDAMLVPKIPTVTLGPSPTINLDVGAVFSISVSLFGEPYDGATLAFIVLDPAQGVILFQGIPVRVGSGSYEARLTASQTQNMTPGAYELRVVGTSPDAAVPAIVKESFLAYTVAGVLESLIKATEDALKTDIGNLQNRVDTIDQSTSALSSNLASVSNLVIIVLALSIIAIASSVVSLMILLRRLPKPASTRPEVKEEHPPEEL